MLSKVIFLILLIPVILHYANAFHNSPIKWKFASACKLTLFAHFIDTSIIVFHFWCIRLIHHFDSSSV